MREVDGQILFIRTLERGGSEHSFGIHVARLAGMPLRVVQRAQVMLEVLETQRQPEVDREQLAGASKISLQDLQKEDPNLKVLRERLGSYQLNEMTPLQALAELDTLITLAGLRDTEESKS